MGSEVIAAVAMTRLVSEYSVLLKTLLYLQICDVNQLSVTFLLHFLLCLPQLLGAALVFEAAFGTNPLVLPVSSGSLPSLGLPEKRDPDDISRLLKTI